MNYSDLKLIDHAKKLFPLNRSITGDGTRKTLDYFEGYFPGLNRVQFKTGEKVFDWCIPEEWNVNDAFIIHNKTGKKYADFKNLNSC